MIRVSDLCFRSRAVYFVKSLDKLTTCAVRHRLRWFWSAWHPNKTK